MTEHSRPTESEADGAAAASAATRAESAQARVRRVLVDPLEREGMRRKAGVTLEAHQEAMKGLAAEVDHLDEEELAVLRTALRPLGQGPRRDVWPSPITVAGIANGLRARTLRDCPLTTSWMRSRAGRAAWEEGEDVAVELLEFFARAKRGRRPPTDFDMGRLRERAADRTAACRRARARLDAGEGTDADRDLVERHEKLVDVARRFVFAGEEG